LCWSDGEWMVVLVVGCGGLRDAWALVGVVGRKEWYWSVYAEGYCCDELGGTDAQERELLGVV